MLMLTRILFAALLVHQLVASAALAARTTPFKPTYALFRSPTSVSQQPAHHRSRSPFFTPKRQNHDLQTTQLSVEARTPLLSTIPATLAGLSPIGALRTRGGVGLSVGSTSIKQAITALVNDIGASKTKSWAVLVCAILIETFAATLSKRARDMGSPTLFLCAISMNLFSMCCFCACLAKLDVGVAYAVWAALGTVIVSTAGILFFQETCDPIKILSIIMVILGVVGLNLRDSH